MLQFTIGRARSRRATLYRDVGREEVDYEDDDDHEDGGDDHDYDDVGRDEVR